MKLRDAILLVLKQGSYTHEYVIYSRERPPFAPETDVSVCRTRHVPDSVHVFATLATIKDLATDIQKAFPDMDVVREIIRVVNEVQEY